MPLYRVVRNLHFKGTILLPGAVSRLSGLSEEALEVLLAKGIVRAVQGPPLSELSGWRVRADRLASRAGITGSVQFLEARPEEIASVMAVSPALIRRWQEEVERSITVAPARAKA